MAAATLWRSSNSGDARSSGTTWTASPTWSHRTPWSSYLRRPRCPRPARGSRWRGRHTRRPAGSIARRAVSCGLVITACGSRAAPVRFSDRTCWSQVAVEAVAGW